MHKQINKYDYFLMCILFYFTLVRLSVCAFKFAIHSMYANLSFKTTIMNSNCGSAFEPAWSAASAFFIFPKTHAGKESTLPMAVLTQELLLHAERCMRHEDVSKTIMLACLNRTLDE